MNATELLERIIASGADEKGIRDRFCGNVDLYESCFYEFMEEPSFATLQDAIRLRNYEQAFEAAHALKGLSGNLGITDFYNAIRTLTNSLKNSEYDRIDDEYAEVAGKYERLRRIVSDEPLPAQAAGLGSSPPSASGKSRLWDFRTFMKDSSNRLFVYLLCATVVIITVIGVLFRVINRTHNQNVMAESGQHLTEISNQIKLYIEESIGIDWRIARSVGESIFDGTYVDDDPTVLNILQKNVAVWGVSDLMLYTESGHCIYSDGSTEATDIATRTAYNAHMQGKYLSLVESKLIFTVPVDTTLTFRGSKIMAVSAVRDMSSFLDDMDFSSFGGQSWMCLTDQNGVVVSSLTSPYTVQSFSVQAGIKGMEVSPLDDDCSPEDFLICPSTEVFTLSGPLREVYCVSTPIATESEPMRLFFFVPKQVVNSIMGGFARQLMIISMVIICLFSAVALAVFVFLYKSRKKMFDQAIKTREKMFNLLIKNTKTAFGLFTVNQPQPDYLSANAAEVIGDSYWTLEKTDAGFSVRNDKSIETENIALVNQTLQQWDGSGTFRSGYLCNRQSAPPSYFIFELYPVDSSSNDFIGIAQDYTPVYAREEAARSAMESVKQANEAKTNFLSSMSHDIRTPMNAIMNMSTFALENIDQPKKLNNYLRVIHESAEHLLLLINDVLDMSRIESGQLVVASVPFDIREEIQRQVDIIRPLCEAKSQTLITDFSGLKKTIVCGDALKLSQIVINLLSNATKFTPERGAVRFIAKELPSLRKDTVAVHFTIEDNGIGIPEADVKSIFEPFSRSKDKMISRIEGTGLGLAIVKNYVTALGGTIRCESEYGEGSIFTVDLFFQREASSIDNSNTNAALTHVSFLGMHALVVEDNHTNQLIAKEMLERMGFILDFADDGSTAVQVFNMSKPLTYDVIYMDIQMPIMNGIEATMAIRAGNHPQAKTIPIIAMTANAFAEDMAKAKAAGMDGYLAKPIVSSDLAVQTKNAIEHKRGESK